MLMLEDRALHVRFRGRSEDLRMADLGLHAGSGDDELRAALARRYDAELAELAEYVIVRGEAALIVRPVAFYG